MGADARSASQPIRDANRRQESGKNHIAKKEQSISETELQVIHLLTKSAKRTELKTKRKYQSTIRNIAPETLTITHQYATTFISGSQSKHSGWHYAQGCSRYPARFFLFYNGREMGDTL